MRDFDKFNEQFDKDFNRARKLAVGWFILVALLALTVLAGFGFVIFKVLTHFGIL